MKIILGAKLEPITRQLHLAVHEHGPLTATRQLRLRPERWWQDLAKLIAREGYELHDECIVIEAPRLVNGAAQAAVWRDLAIPDPTLPFGTYVADDGALHDAGTTSCVPISPRARRASVQLASYIGRTREGRLWRWSPQHRVFVSEAGDIRLVRVRADEGKESWRNDSMRQAGRSRRN